MKRTSNRFNRLLSKALIPAAIAALCFQIAPPGASGQTKSGSLLNNLATNRNSTTLRVAFSYSPAFPVVGQRVQFRDLSSGNPGGWQWDFGDGTVSAEENPSHVFGAAGFRRVTLVATRGTVARRVSRSLAVMPAPAAASFVFSPGTPGPGQVVQFTDTSTGNPTTWAWAFGDGATSSAKNPTHVFLKAGGYAVSLVSTGSAGPKQASKTVTVASVSVLTSSFSYIPALPSVGQTVQFTDTSAGSPSSWSWNFGDGATSTVKSPTHAYATAGAKTVTLTVTDGTSSNASSQTLTVAAALAASFSFNPTSPVTGQAIQFTDLSSGSPTSWSWNFGDGTTSTAQNPAHTYATAGTKTVTLTAANGSGSNSVSRTVTVIASLTASFTYSPSSPAAGTTVQFTDTSTGSPTSWSWAFGDGSTSTAQNPTHAYTTAGAKTVTLTAANGSGSNSVSRTVTVVASLAASFTYSPSSPAAGTTVQFTDTSTGSPTSWSWAFGDGSTSTAQNPTHAYTTAGAKTVTLTATGPAGSSSASRTVTVAAALTASFTYSPSSPAAGTTVQFTDTSTGSPTSWSWTFGDGSTSTAQNPTHAYTTAGSKTVTLTATNGTGSNSASRTVTVAASLTASFGYSPASPTAGQSVQFTDTSTGGPTSWSWNFNDGTTSTAQNPSHAFTAAGSYSVTLVAANASTSKSVTQVVTVASASTLTASFGYSPSSPTPSQSVQFTDTSTGTPTSWSWDFGDGATSTAQNPSHAYSTVGSKTVTLTVTGSTGSDSVSRTLTVAEESASVIPADRKIDWSYCGVPGGIPARTTVATTLNPGATTAQINSAISACPAGQVVYLNAGTYNNIGAINFGSKNGVTLRGAGAGLTIINSTVSGGNYGVTSDYYGFTGAATISSGFTKDSTSLVMAATPTNFTVGKLIAVYENDDTTLVMATDGPGQNLKTIHKVTAKSGNTLTISPPLPYTLSAGLSPRAAYCAGTGATLCGLEDLTINNSGAVNAIIAFSNADRCWVKGIETYNADNMFLWIYESFQFEMRHSYCYHAKGSPNNPDGYGVYLYEGSSFCLIEDNIFYELAAGCLLSKASCNAFLYNYGWKTTFNGSSFQFCMINCNHGAHDMMDLWEGNVVEQWQNDAYHGSASHQTLFRNWINGLHPTNTINRKMIDIGRAGYYHNVVGNVLGASSWTPAAYEMTGQVDLSMSCIYRLGYPNMTNNDYAAVIAWSSYGLSYPDAKVKATLLRHGNYDYYNKATQWDASISNHTLPASLYYTSKPAYFGSLQWPPIGPDVAGYVTNIPAKARWEAYQGSGSKSDLF